MDSRQDVGRMRAVMALIGAAGGGSAWWLFEELPGVVDSDRTQLALTVAVLGFFLQIMAHGGPVPLRRAVVPALAFGGAVAGLIVWASFRFDGAEALARAGHPFAALFVITLVGTPFLSVILEHGPGRWRDYPALFQTAWSIIVRFAAAGLFAGVFWGVLFLSDALLNLVGIEVIENLLDHDPAPYVIHGAVLGVALAVAHEWRTHVSPHLLLRLLRLLVPLVVPVLALFLLAVAMEGLTALPGVLSETGLLVAVAVGGVTLVTVAMDRDARQQVQARALVWGAKALAVMLLPLTVLTVWALWRQVAGDGWTPEQVMLAVCTGILLLYGVSYALSALWPGDWGARVRQVNVWLALLTLGLAVLWQTPILNAERISARSQVTRILAGVVAPEKAMLWEMSHDWGRPGLRAVAELQAEPEFPQRDTVLERLARVRTADRRSEFERTLPARKEAATQLASLMPLLPEGTNLPDRAFDNLPEWLLETAKTGCENRFQDGKPGCAYLEASFFPDSPDRQGVILVRGAPGRVLAYGVELLNERLTDPVELRDLRDKGHPLLDDASLRAVLEGNYSFAPKQVRVLELGGRALFPNN